MSEDKISNKHTIKFEKKEEKIPYSVNKIVCFACGEKIDKDIDMCPYCETFLV